MARGVSTMGKEAAKGAGKKAAKGAGKKAAKATVKHTARGVASKAQRKPLRSATLLAVGGFVGATAGWVAGRTTARRATSADA
jgi:hypothetical protein